jgi:hypothetical protein
MLLLVSFSFILLNAETIENNNTIIDDKIDIYTGNCLPCHEYMPASLERIFMSYLKKYSGEITVKETLKEFLRNPTKESSVMSELFISQFGVKEKTILSEKELNKAINIYWNKYNVRKKLK